MYEELYAPIPDISAYLQRLQITPPVKADKKTLDALVYAHQCHVTFENLDTYKYNRDISLAITDIFQKVIKEKRGGYCFELNGLFTQLLKELGYQAYSCMCRIVRNKNFTPPTLHRGILVDIDNQLYFCDVGYGGPMPPGAVAVCPDSEFQAYGETFHINKKDNYWWALDRITSHGEIEHVIEFHTMPQENVDFIAMNYYCSHNENSIFTQVPFINRRIAGGSCSIMGDTFTLVEHGQTKTQAIKTWDDFNELLKKYFHLFL